MSGSLIHLRNVSLIYPKMSTPVFTNLCLAIEPGRFYAVVGANGRGKTSLCRMLADLIPSFFEGEITGSVDRYLDSARIQYVGDHPDSQLSGVTRSVRNELAFGLENLGQEPRTIQEQVSHWGHRLGLDPWLDIAPRYLSGGLKQKVAIGAALVVSPQLLILDEPTSQLDPAGTLLIFQLLQQLKREEGLTVVVAEHKISALTEVADEFLPLDLPEVTRTYAVDQFLDRPLVERCGAPMPPWVVVQSHLVRQIAYGSWQVKVPEFQEQIKKLVKR